MAIRIECKGADVLPIDAIEEFQGNLKKRTKKDIDQIITSIEKYGFSFPFFIWNGTGHNLCLDGHGRIQALAEMRRRGEALPLFPVVYVDAKDDAEAKQKLLRLNSQYGQMTIDSVLEFADGIELDTEEIQLPSGMLEFSEQGKEEIDSDDKKTGSLSDEFLISPFSILDARTGWWQDRKRSWLAIGIKSELGRGENALGSSEACNKAMSGKVYGTIGGQGASLGQGLQARKGKDGKLEYVNIKNSKACGTEGNISEATGTSIFDPVLCEIAYTWFSPKSGIILDPFAGGSVRGIVASKLGRQYIGCELRPEQVEANRNQAKEIIKDKENIPVWHTTDSMEIKSVCDGVEADMIFTCPPYADLEVYSDNPKDISTMKYDEFKQVYSEIIKRTASLLKEDSFACVVVGEVRDKNGNYYNFVGDTIKAFTEAGLKYYNEIILATAIGSLPIRAGKVFRSGRKIGKTHQNVLVFVKGSGKKASERCGNVNVYLPEEGGESD